MNKRNGTIDFLRFLFCLIILVYHFSCDNFGTDWRPVSWGGVLRYGALAVEFFFITSGYFTAKSISKQSDESKNIAEDTWSFMWKKLKPILPYHICFNLVMILINIILRKSIVEILHKLSSLCFLPTLGFNNFEWAMGSEWYIGNMLFAMLIIYPCIRKGKRFFSNYIAPVLTLILYGYLATCYSSVMGSNRILEAFAGIMLGISVYNISKPIKEMMERKRLGTIPTCIIRIYPLFVLVFFVIYMNTSLSTSIQPFIVLILGSALAITYAEEGLISKAGILNNQFVYWLGKMSLPIYMVQNITRAIVMNCFNIRSVLMTYIVEGIFTIIAGILSYYIFVLVNKRLFHARRVSDYQ